MWLTKGSCPWINLYLSMQVLSPQSIFKTNLRFTLSPMASVQPVKLSSFLGKPSMRKSFFSDSFMALSRSEQVIFTGTIVPLTIWCSITSPCSDPWVCRSARNKSPMKKKKRKIVFVNSGLLFPCPFWIRFCQLNFYQKFPNFFWMWKLTSIGLIWHPAKLIESYKKCT